MGLLKTLREIKARKHTHILVRDCKYTGKLTFGDSLRLDNKNYLEWMYFKEWCRKHKWKYVKLNK